jgi:hypothetical protein
MSSWYWQAIIYFHVMNTSFFGWNFKNLDQEISRLEADFLSKARFLESAFQLLSHFQCEILELSKLIIEEKVRKRSGSHMRMD